MNGGGVIFTLSCFHIIVFWGIKTPFHIETSKKEEEMNFSLKAVLFYLIIPRVRGSHLDIVVAKCRTGCIKALKTMMEWPINNNKAEECWESCKKVIYDQDICQVENKTRRLLYCQNLGCRYACGFLHRDDNIAKGPNNTKRARKRRGGGVKRGPRDIKKRVRLQFPQIKGCEISWFDPLRSATNLYKENTEEDLDLVYVLLGRNNRSKWIDLAQTSRLKMTLNHVEVRGLESLKLAAVSGKGIEDQIQINITKIRDCGRLPEPMLQIMTESTTTAIPSKRNKMLHYMVHPPDRYFWPLIASCLSLGSILLVTICCVVVRCRSLRKRRINTNNSKRSSTSLTRATLHRVSNSPSSHDLDMDSAVCPGPTTSQSIPFTAVE